MERQVTIPTIGVAHQERGPISAETLAYKVLAGRFYNAGAKLCDLVAALLSIAQTCRTMGIKSQEYLEDMFRRVLDHPGNRLEALLLGQWLKTRGTHPCRSKDSRLIGPPPHGAYLMLT